MGICVATRCCSPHGMWCRRLAGIWLRIRPEGVGKKRNGVVIFECPAVGRRKMFFSLLIAVDQWERIFPTLFSLIEHSVSKCSLAE